MKLLLIASILLVSLSGFASESDCSDNGPIVVKEIILR